ncbi:MAG TPA: DUF4240 domain-containing protein [Myxococcales bacterium LLY-WYZ-16_1]|nr:DUF4240 domain-containing protein [Myxococcales bacterium LLY-WYZ-16_1]
MNERRFWELVETHVERGTGAVLNSRPLVRALASLAPEDIAAFDQMFRDLHAQSCSYRLWGAAELLLGGCSDTAFDGFRAWLIGMGEQTFRNALIDPDSLADVVESDSRDFECEELLRAAPEAFEVATGGKDLEQPSLELPEAGTPVDFDDPEAMRRLYPRLYDRFGPSAVVP